MAKFKFGVSTGYVNSACEEVVEIPDDELEGLNDKERDEVVNSYYDAWLQNNIETWAIEI